MGYAAQAIQLSVEQRRVESVGIVKVSVETLLNHSLPQMEDELNSYLGRVESGDLELSIAMDLIADSANAIKRRCEDLEKAAANAASAVRSEGLVQKVVKDME